MTRRLLGWSMREAAFASRLKRCAKAPSAGLDGLRTLMATVFLRFSCVALYTQPIAPRPTMASMRTLSAMVRPTRASYSAGGGAGPVPGRRDYRGLANETSGVDPIVRPAKPGLCVQAV